MDFTFIVPTYNSQEYIYDCLNAIFSVEYPDGQYEVVIVDGGSKDNTLSIINSFNKAKVVNSSNISIANSRNIGATVAQGKYLVFIDSDCVIDKQLLNKSNSFMGSYACYGSFYKAHERHGWVAKTWLEVERKHTGPVKWLTSGTMVMAKQTFIDVNGFDETLQVEEDEDICYRIRQNGGSLYNDTTVASVHLGQSDSIMMFINKEAWRGRSLVKPLVSMFNKKISLFDLTVYLYFVTVIALIFSMFYLCIEAIIVCFTIMIFIPVVMSTRAVIRTKNYGRYAQMVLLYIIFYFARAWSIIKYNQFRQFFKTQSYQ